MHKLLHTTCLLLMVAGCAMQPAQKDTANYWWYARYRISPDENGQTKWPVDLLIADRIIEPVLNKHRDEIRLWRFHRRSVDDSTGHQFSFIFYSDKQTAANIYAELKADPLGRSLLQKNIVHHFLTDAPDDNHRTAIEATSDKNWSEPMQKHWPEYIMGVSELWLGLINEFAQQNTGGMTDMLAEYEWVDGEIRKLWYAEEKHALFHHMHAIFGYPPEKNNN